MTENHLKPAECAKEARISRMTINRWINKGYRGKRLYAERAGRQWRINPDTWRRFLYETKQLSNS